MNADSTAYRIVSVIPAKPRAARSSGRLSAAADQFTQRWDDHVRHAQPAAKIIPECDTEFGACLGQPQERVAAIPPLVTSRPGADLAPCDLAANVVLRTVFSSSALWALSRASSRSSVANPVRRRKMRSNRARSTVR